ncbi:phospho-sugar mutase [Alicyclobacillus sp. SO9]|uniref:phospho-sugar mutase n=1 Tax=Alicyclobacillus sp. SO9 TaxID=2665646 RepID=UPI0018E8177B|nr:phospho-sugar mutase [Alicyclobacillus sp. SO9]QQE76850.1 phospho-sugar mutase [Alicyclobacillus sp. SO9]
MKSNRVVERQNRSDTDAEFEKWLNQSTLPQDLRRELVQIQGDREKIRHHFGQSLKFGTGGMRGILGPGPNRMNIYTVRKATWALGKFLLQLDSQVKTRGVAVGYDSRHKSEEFALQVGLTLAALGIKSFVSPYLCPTPEVSFTVRHLQAAAGVMITASHNPPEYNGYKVYGADGCQFLPDVTEQIRRMMDDVEDIFSIQTASLDNSTKNGLLQRTNESVRDTYVRRVVEELSFSSNSPSNREALHIVYTPLHGTGNIPVRKALHLAGYKHVDIVTQQAQPDPNFSTVESPNPGSEEALNLGVDLADQVNADMVLGTDPDCDRVGIAVRDKERNFIHLSGNQTGALMADFVLRRQREEGTLPQNGLLFKTIVTSDLGQAVAQAYDISVENTLTGFKYIGHRATEEELTGEHPFIMGYEESYGYLLSDIVRDKDGVQACVVAAEMAAYYKGQGLTLGDRLDELFQQFGTYAEFSYSIPLEASGAEEQRTQFMDNLRKTPPQVTGLELLRIEDYLHSISRNTEHLSDNAAESQLSLPKSNVLKYIFKDQSWMAIRPSGTEPKMKIYLAAHGIDKEDTDTKIQNMRQSLAEVPSFG